SSETRCTSMNVLVLNAGSSSLKFQLIRTAPDRIAEDGDVRLARGTIERIGGHAILTLEAIGEETHRETGPIRDHQAALDRVLRWIVEPPVGEPLLGSLGEIDAVGHRVVHGGEQFRRSVLIDEAVRRALEDTIELAPLHNPHNLRMIQAA